MLPRVGGFPDEVVGLALTTRHVIGVAVGLLMARHGLAEDRPFQLLCRVSSQQNTKLKDLAAVVVARGGRLPGQRDG